MNDSNTWQSGPATFDQIAMNLMSKGYFKKAKPHQLIRSTNSYEPEVRAQEAANTWNILN